MVGCSQQNNEATEHNIRQQSTNDGNELNENKIIRINEKDTNEQSDDEYSTIDHDEDFFGDLQIELGKEFSWSDYQPIGPRISNSSQLNLVVDGILLNINPPPMIKDGSTLLPLRALSSHFGASVDWAADTRTVTINKADTAISFVVGDSKGIMNGKQVSIPPSLISNNSTFVPIRFISEAFGYPVNWDSGSRTVKIATTPNQYTVVAGDTLWSIATKFKLTVDQIKQLNNLSSDTLQAGQTLVLSQEKVKEQVQQQTTRYTVVSGDTLSRIASKFNTTVDQIKSINRLSSDSIYVNQVLDIPSGNSSNSGNSTPSSNQGVTKTYTTHTVQSGDTAWGISIKYGIPMLELLKENNLSLNSGLSLGQKLRVPVYNVPIKTTVSSSHGELLDWWSEARYVFPIGKEATITDFKTGKQFKVRHTMGGNHADVEPLTSRDTQMMKEIWGGAFSWTPRAVIISVDGRKIAAAMHSYPHADQTIRDNNFAGHSCIHFLNSTRHNDGLVQDSMQVQIKLAAGVK